MAFSLFGFTFGGDTNKGAIVSPIAPDKTSTTIDVESMPGMTNLYVNGIDLDNTSQTEIDLINQYRGLMNVPEVEQGVEEIVNEAIVYPDEGKIVDLTLEDSELPPNIKKEIEASYDKIYSLLNFANRGHEIFTRFYVDGRLPYHVLIDQNDPKEGVLSVRYIDPRKLKKIREIIRSTDQQGNAVVTGVKEYYIYNETVPGLNSGMTSAKVSTASRLNIQTTFTRESIVYVTSGKQDPNNNITISYLHSAIRPANNLRMMEDAMLIYRLARAPERRIFYIDTGNLPKGKSEQYVDELAKKHRSKIIYDISTGEIKQDKRYMAMSEDYWIPRKQGSQGTQIETLPGGEQIGETGEPDYFKEKLYTALKVPASRFSKEPSLFGAGTEVTRDEMRFMKFIEQLRLRFNNLFLELMKRDLMLRGVMDEEEFDEYKTDFAFKYAKDNFFSEAFRFQVVSQQLEIIQQIDPFVGKYFTREYVMSTIRGLTEEEVEEEYQQMELEAEMFPEPEEEAGV